MEKQTMGEVLVTEYILTYLWIGMECFAAILLFDGFSERKREQSVYWFVIFLYIILISSAINFIMPEVANFGRMVFVIASYAFLHGFLYRGVGLFSLYISAIYYGTICCIDNSCFIPTKVIWNRTASFIFSVSLPQRE